MNPITVKAHIAYAGHNLSLWITPFDGLWYFGFMLLIILIFKDNLSKYTKRLLLLTAMSTMCFAKGSILMSPILYAELMGNIIPFFIGPLIWLFIIKRNTLWLLVYVPVLSFEVTLTQGFSTIPFVWFWLLQTSLLCVPYNLINNGILKARNYYMIIYPEGMVRDLNTGKYYGTYCEIFDSKKDDIKIKYARAISKCNSIDEFKWVSGFNEN